MLTLELLLPESVAGVGGLGRARTMRLVWHDTIDFSLAKDGLALVEGSHPPDGAHPRWQLQRFRPASPSAEFVPGAPDMVIAERDDLMELAAKGGFGGADDLVPMVRLEARQRSLRPTRDLVVGTVIEGVLHAAASERPVRLLRLTGPAPAVVALAADWQARVSGTSLAAMALALVQHGLPPRRTGAPIVAANVSVGAAVGHIVGHLFDVILHFVPQIAAGQGPEAVHQTRVATRRLRSALGLFAKFVACPELAAIKADMRDMAAMLGPARDWDVFLGATGAAIAAALPDDPAVLRLLAAAKRRRRAAYASLLQYLNGPVFRRLSLRLASFVATRPWEGEATDGVADLAGFAVRALKKRHARIVATVEGADGAGIAGLSIPALHSVRLQAKRLRYAAEFLAPLFPPRAIAKYLRRLAELQEALGHLNDASVATTLMAELAAAGGLGYGGGVVRGFVVATTGDAKGEIFDSWKRFHKRDTKALFAAVRVGDLNKD